MESGNRADWDGRLENEDGDYPVRIDNVSISNLGFIVFLRHRDDARVLPIFIGGNEAHSIAKELNGQTTPRPMTHDLMYQMLDSMGWRLSRIRINHIEENTFYARLYLEHPSFPPLDFDARPSDALALALRFHANIGVHPRVYDQASVAIASRVNAPLEAPEPKIAPTGKTEAAASKDDVQDLQKRLAKAIHEEHYEEAAKLRDALRVALKRLQDGN